MARRVRSPRQLRSRRKRRNNRTTKLKKDKKSLRGGARLPTESECLELFKSKKPNAGLNASYSFCKHWLSRKKYLEEAQKRYGKAYGHYSFVRRKLFGTKHRADHETPDTTMDDAEGYTESPGPAESPPRRRAHHLLGPHRHAHPLLGIDPLWPALSREAPAPPGTSELTVPQEEQPSPD